MSNLQVEHDMGKWVPGRELEWTWYMNLSRQQVYKKEDNMWNVYMMGSNRTRNTSSLLKETEERVQELPIGSTGCTVEDIKGRWKVTGLIMAEEGVESEGESEEEDENGIESDDSINKLHKGMRKHESKWVTTGETEWPSQQGAGLARAIEQSRLIGMSDGSCWNGRGTCAWTITSSEETWKSSNIVSRYKGVEVDPYRCELQGIYSVLVAIEIICQTYQITEGSVVVSCDGESALKDAFRTKVAECYEKKTLRLAFGNCNDQRSYPGGINSYTCISAPRRCQGDGKIEWYGKNEY